MMRKAVSAAIDYEGPAGWDLQEAVDLMAEQFEVDAEVLYEEVHKRLNTFEASTLENLDAKPE
jgi:hypothetical protein